ncbi:hypothetical protein KSP39_PZI023410 [Platanthera zijinensis]|uniref:Uncharacterized protein n=1 Tax=Platanthera zijinensis TaxID=2320716 RepID=A0AAP0AS80_9ASPA
MIARIFLFHRLLISRTIPFSPAPLSRRSFYSRFSVDPSPFFPARSLSSSPAGDSKLAKPKSLSSIFSNPSAVDSREKVTQRPGHYNAEKGKREVKKLPQTINRSSMFCHMKEKEFPKELSAEAESLLRILCEELGLKLELGQIPVSFPSRHLLKSAAEKLGLRRQEIAKWLSGSDLKKVALFGCPSIERKTVFASKRLRSFFSIQEDVVCRGCKIKASCNFVNQRVNKVDRVILADVMRLLTVLSLDAVPQQLLVPTDVKLSVDKLLKEAVNLSQLQL